LFLILHLEEPIGDKMVLGHSVQTAL